MKTNALIALTVFTLAAAVGFSQNAGAFCLFATDCPGGSATVSVEVDAACKADSDCPYGQQCNTATGACFTPSSATLCSCAPDGDLCTDDAGTMSASGGCFCLYNRLATPECTKKDGETPIGILTPINVEPLLPIVPGGKTPVDPPPSYGPDPDVAKVCDDPTFTPELRACCESVGGSPLAMMEKCVSGDKSASDCDIVVNVMGDIGNKAQMNVCCNVLNNSGSIADSDIVQECRNTFADEGSSADTAPSGGETPKKTTETGVESKSFASDADSPSGGCSLIRE
ncbi:MAG TPA: hypothetical protein VFX30_02505 [bacterium]|nr:hypothetical protein [bacterium]